MACLLQNPPQPVFCLFVGRRVRRGLGEAPTRELQRDRAYKDQSEGRSEKTGCLVGHDGSYGPLLTAGEFDLDLVDRGAESPGEDRISVASQDQSVHGASHPNV